MVAAHALNGLLASQEPDKGWQIDALAVVSLQIADRVLHYNAQAELPKLQDARPDEAPAAEEPAIYVEPTIITPRE